MTEIAVVSAYVASCAGCSGRTASGLRADAALGLVAASEERALGSCVEIEIRPGTWSSFLVADRGGGLPARGHVHLGAEAGNAHRRARP